APASPPPPAAGTEAFGYAVRVDPPDEGVGPTLTDRSGVPAPAADIAAAASAAALARTREKRKARRRRGAAATDRGYRDEYMTLDDDPEPPPQDEPPTTQASSSGAGPLGRSGGFTGTTPKTTSKTSSTSTSTSTADAAGLTTLPGDGFGDGPRSPMLPRTWEEDPPENSR
ncbi:PPW family C-terminal domain-containing PPE protein, partial [Mycolicibacterium palauense]